MNDLAMEIITMIEWNDSTSALNDMLRSELVQHWIDDATREMLKHRNTAGHLTDAGQYDAALKEMALVNEYRQRIANWREALEAEASNG